MNRTDNVWDQRYARDEYLFGVEPNAFLARQANRLPSGGRALAVADGEGRNGVWLAEQGLTVLYRPGCPSSVRASAVRPDGRTLTLKSQTGPMSIRCARRVRGSGRVADDLDPRPPG